MTKKQIKDEIIAIVFNQRQYKYEMSMLGNKIKEQNKKLDKLYKKLNKLEINEKYGKNIDINACFDNVMELDLSKIKK